MSICRKAIVRNPAANNLSMLSIWPTKATTIRYPVAMIAMLNKILTVAIGNDSSSCSFFFISCRQIKLTLCRSECEKWSTRWNSERASTGSERFVVPVRETMTLSQLRRPLPDFFRYVYTVNTKKGTFSKGLQPNTNPINWLMWRWWIILAYQVLSLIGFWVNRLLHAVCRSGSLPFQTLRS